MAAFAELGLAPALADHIRDSIKFEAPTAIQQAAIPVILSGKDVLVRAETGTGKTLAYLAPMVSLLQASKARVTRADGTFALVLVPTRELCVQVCAVAEQLLRRFVWLVPGCVMGGENRAKEKARLRKGITLLVATPGRLLDHLKNTASFRHDLLRWVVFDEADRLLDMGFKNDIQEILRVLDSSHEKAGAGLRPQGRQHMLLSATLNEDVENLATLSLKDPTLVFVGGDVLSPPTQQNTNSSGKRKRLDVDSVALDGREGHTNYCIPQQIEQNYLLVSCRLRLISLLCLLHQRSSVDGACKLVAFFSTCDSVDFHFSLINGFQWSRQSQGKQTELVKAFPGRCFRLHGSMDQKERMQSYLDFSRTAPALLLCTDVAARGLDFQDVTCIVQYDPPGDAADYVHRVGRTARIGHRGEAVLFLQPREADYMKELETHGVALKRLSLEEILSSVQTSRAPMKGDWNRPEIHPTTLAMHRALEAFIGRQRDLRLLAVDAFRSYVRAYAVHQGELKGIFHVRNLHLGHVAKSFGLCDAPSMLGQSSHKLELKRKRKEQQQSRKKRKLKPAAVTM